MPDSVIPKEVELFLWDMLEPALPYGKVMVTNPPSFDFLRAEAGSGNSIQLKVTRTDCGHSTIYELSQLEPFRRGEPLVVQARSSPSFFQSPPEDYIELEFDSDGCLSAIYGLGSLD